MDATPTDAVAGLPGAAIAPDSQPAVVQKTEPGDPESMALELDPAGQDVAVPNSLDEAERRLLDWHWANLEYGCSARLSEVSPEGLLSEGSHDSGRLAEP